MISLSKLQQKLSMQAKLFAMHLTIPDLIGEGLFARGVYNFLNFNEAKKALYGEFNKNKLQSVLDHDTLKYLLINEIDDQEIIEELHNKIEQMAFRIERLEIIKAPLLNIISAFYRSLGLIDESNFIVNTGAEFTLTWKPYFHTLSDVSEILYTDLKIQNRTYRLVASKYCLSTISYEDIKAYMNIRLIQKKELSKEMLDAELCNIEDHKDWLIDSMKCFFGDKLPKEANTPMTFNIFGKRYLIFGFMLTNNVSRSEEVKAELKLNVKFFFERQKYFIKIDQQALVFEAESIGKGCGLPEYSTEHQSSIKQSLMSHSDASNKWHKINESGFVMTFRPITVDEWSKC